MILEYIRYEVANPDELIAAYQRARLSLDAAPDCRAYELSQCADDPLVFMLRIEWTSADGHMNGFRKSAEFREFFAAVQPFVTSIREMRHYHLTSVAALKP